MAKSTVDVVLGVIDRITAPLNAIQRRIDRLTEPMRRVARGIADMGRSAGIDRLASRFANLGSSLGNVARHVATLAAGFGSLFALGVGAGLTQFVSVNAEFEKFGAVLETVLGSSEKAQASLAWISDFAAETPYALAEVTDSFVRLTGAGVDPLAGSLASAGDAAAAMGRPLGDAVEALTDAMTGENERLKGFNIRTSQVGDSIKYMWSENGRQMVAIAKKNSSQQIEAVVTGIWNRRYGGAGKKLMTTWDGMVSNLGDTWSRFVLSIGKAGAFDKLKGVLSDVLGWFNKMSSSGNLDAWAKGISDSMSGVTDQFRDFLLGYDVVGDRLGEPIHIPGFLDELPQRIADLTKTLGEVGQGFRDFYAGMKPAIDLLGGPGNAVLAVLAAVTFGPLVASLVSLTGAFVSLGVAMLTTPIGWIIAGIAGIGAVVYVLYQRWDEFKAYWANLWTRVGEAFQQSWASGILAVLNEFNPLKHIMVGINAMIDYLFGIDLFAAGGHMIDSFMNGIASKLDGLKSMLPDFMGGSGGEVTVGQTKAVLENLDPMGNFTGVPSIAAPALPAAPRIEIPRIIDGQGYDDRGVPVGGSDTAAPSLSVPDFIRQSSTGAVAGSSSRQITTGEVDAATARFGAAEFPEPIIANQPQNVVSTFSPSLTFNMTGMDRAQGQAMVEGILAAERRRHEANVRSALGD